MGGGQVCKSGVNCSHYETLIFNVDLRPSSGFPSLFQASLRVPLLETLPKLLISYIMLSHKVVSYTKRRTFCL